MAACLFAAPVASQHDTVFERIGVDEGLSTRYTQAGVQDRFGFMWFGTDNGLNRYDGYSFTIFKHRPSQEGSISSSTIQSLFNDAAGTLWIGTDRGLNRFDPATETFETFLPHEGDLNHRANAIAWIDEDRRGNLWLVTGTGITSFHIAEQRFTSYAEHLPASRALRYVLHVTHDGSVVASLPPVEGLLRIDADGRAHVHRHAADDPRGLPHRRVSDLATDGDGNLWVASLGGLSRLTDAGQGQFEHFGSRPGSVGPLPDDSLLAMHYDQAGSLWLLSPAAASRLDVRRREIVESIALPVRFGVESDPWFFEDRSGRMWIRASGGPALVLLDPQTGSVTKFAHDRSDPESISANSVGSIVEDSVGGLWIVSVNAGLNRIDPSRKAFRHIRHRPDDPHGLNHWVVSHFTERSDGKIWVATNGGISLLDPTTGQLRLFSDATGVRLPSELSSTRFVYVDRSDRLWAATWNSTELFLFDPARRAWDRFRMDQDRSSPGGELSLIGVFEDRAGTIWVSSTSALRRLEADGRTFRIFRHDPADPASVPFAGVGKVVEDAAGTKWFASYSGLSRLDDEEAGTFTHFRNEPGNPNSLSKNWVMSIHFDRSGVLWLGTVGGGLNRYDPATDTFTYYSEEHGLSHDEILGIVEDDHGRLWLSTGTGGISRFDPATETFRNFSVSHGLQGLEFQDVSYLRASTGEIYFGGFNGFNVFHPDDIRDDTTPPPVVLTSLRLFGKPFFFDRPLAELPEAVFRHQQNALAFNFVALNYGDVAGNRFSYFLEGFDREWNHAGARRDASYTNLPPGRYTFRVRAANSDGVWNDEGAALRIVILPPWWRTGWAYGLYGLMFAGGVVGVDRVQRRRVVRRERERARERELAQAREIERAYRELKRTQAQLVQQEKLASLGQLTAGIAHEIKNPLNFVNNFSSLSNELIDELRIEIDRVEAKLTQEELTAVGALLSDLRVNLTKIAEHGHRADGIVRSMLEHSRGGKGERQTVELNALVEEYVNLAYHGKRAQDGAVDIRIERDLSAEVGHVDVVPQDLGRVILNLVGNAWDAVAERAAAGDEGYLPLVRVSTGRVNGAVEIRVTDNGPGIPDELRARIFEPFFTTKPAGSGTGLGLSLSHEIVTQGHGGRIGIESEPGEGSIFVVRLPGGSPGT